MIKVLWGVFKDNKSWQEEILSEIANINLDDCLSDNFKKTINL